MEEDRKDGRCGSARTGEASCDRSRKPYVSPEIATEPIFETASLACGKLVMGGQPVSCVGQNNKES